MDPIHLRIKSNLEAFAEEGERIVFAAQIHAIEPGEQELEEVKASLNDLKTLLPDGVDPEDDPSLLFCAANIAVGGVVNRNDDGMDKETALLCYKKFERKFIDFEHSRKQVVGYILRAGLSEIGTNRVISEEEARESDQPFNIAVVFVLWKAINPKLADEIVEASNPAHSDFNTYSLSFEMAFRGFYIIVLPDGEVLISKATKIITPGDESFAKWKKTLRAYKGNGAALEGDGRTYRVLPYNVVPLGGGLVEQPAAPVKGVTVITEVPEVEPQEEPESAPEEVAEPKDEDENEDEDRMSAQVRFDLFYQTAAKLLETRVSSHTTTFTTMNPNDIKEYKAKVLKAEKLEDFKEVAMASTSVIDAIVAESERRENEKKAAETQAAEIARVKAEVESARDQAIKDLNATKDELNSLKTELDQIKAAQVQETMARKFDERMNTVTDVFDLADDERAEVAADIKDLSDEAFAKYMDKAKKLMKEKMKMVKKAKCDEAKAAIERVVANLNEKGVKAKIDDSLNINIEEVIASAVSNPTSTPEGTMIEPGKSLKDRMASALGDMTIGGKKVSELQEVSK